MPAWFGQLGLMAWPLAICSILAVALGFERVVFAVSHRARKEQGYNKLADYLLAHKTYPKSVRDEMVGIMMHELQRPYYRGIKGLRIIGTISPMIGLLGTILGIIAAFKVIAVHSGPVSPSLISEGLWEAMLTTAVGLLIALPALLMAHFFHHVSDRQLGDYALRLNKLSISLEMEKHRSDPPASDSTVKSLAA